MGIFSAIQKQFIKRPDESKNNIVYKWPDENIRKMTQITVQADELALFVKNGQVVGTLESGIHDIEGSNIPFIGGLLANATNGNYFVSEIYFVSIHEFVNILFGGTLDNIVDPQSKLAILLKVYGSYSLKVVDPSNLILNLVGTVNIFNNDEITNWSSSILLKLLRENVAEKINASAWDILGIASRNQEIEELILSPINVELVKYGLNIVSLGNVTINIDEKDEETLKDYRRSVAYLNTPGSADTALKLGAAEGFSKGNANVGLFAAGMNIGSGITANTPPTVASSTQSPSETQLNTDNQIGTGVGEDMIFCPNCGKQIKKSNYCMYCGTKI